MNEKRTMMSILTLFPLLECWEMKRLQKKARQGWVLSGFKNSLQYQLIYQEPQEVMYRTAYQDQPNNTFLTEFKMGGWVKVAQYKDVYIFSGNINEKPVCFDLSYRIKKFKLLRTDVVKTVFMALIPIFFAYFWFTRVTSELWMTIAIAFMGLTIIPFLIALIQLTGYTVKIIRLQKGVICHDKTC